MLAALAQEIKTKEVKKRDREYRDKERKRKREKFERLRELMRKGESVKEKKKKKIARNLIFKNLLMFSIEVNSIFSLFFDIFLHFETYYCIPCIVQFNPPNTLNIPHLHIFLTPEFE